MPNSSEKKTSDGVLIVFKYIETCIDDENKCEQCCAGVWCWSRQVQEVNDDDDDDDDETYFVTNDCNKLSYFLSLLRKKIPVSIG